MPLHFALRPARTAMSWAAMDIAISAGVSAPMVETYGRGDPGHSRPRTRRSFQSAAASRRPPWRASLSRRHSTAGAQNLRLNDGVEGMPPGHDADIVLAGYATLAAILLKSISFISSAVGNSSRLVKSGRSSMTTQRKPMFVSTGSSAWATWPPPKM